MSRATLGHRTTRILNRGWLLRTRGKRILRWISRKAGVEIVRLRPDPVRFDAGDELQYLGSLGIRTVIDVGAHEGEFARHIARALPDAAIYSFEPLGKAFARLSKNLEHHALFRGFNIALGDREERLMIHRNQYSMSSSMLEMEDLHKSAFPFTGGPAVDEEVLVRRLDDVASELSLVEPILVKIDVQGFEDRVIAGGRGILARTKALLVEVSFKELYRGQPLFKDIYQLAADRGFRYIGSLGQLRNPLDGGPLQADALFLRK